MKAGLNGLVGRVIFVWVLYYVSARSNALLLIMNVPVILTIHEAVLI